MYSKMAIQTTLWPDNMVTLSLDSFILKCTLVYTVQGTLCTTATCVLCSVGLDILYPPPSLMTLSKGSRSAGKITVAPETYVVAAYFLQQNVSFFNMPL